MLPLLPEIDPPIPASTPANPSPLPPNPLPITWNQLTVAQRQQLARLLAVLVLRILPPVVSACKEIHFTPTVSISKGG